MKTCNKCGESKQLSEYHRRSSGSADGRFNVCKPCRKDACKKYRANAKNKERKQKQEYYAKNRTAILEKSRKYRAENKETRAAIEKRYAEKNQERRVALRKAQYAIKRGKLVRGPCEVCGTAEMVDAHHCDYSKPLDVMWLCRKHHKQWHMENEVVA